MEDGVKEELAPSKEPKFLGKAGWVKKAPGKLLAAYKDRYVHVEKTDIVVYENEDLQNCLERLDLENYDQCHELKSHFSKKHRLVLIRSAKAGNKVSDVKFQAQSAEEKEAWIKALTDGINRAKNKIFDEVKVDGSSNLEHVTRTRPKGNRNRRPPTRIHMKEVADVSSDGILRLDLNLEDAVMPNGNHYENVDGTEKPNATLPLTTISEDAETSAKEETEVMPQKKVLKPPMPPSKEAKLSSEPEDESDKHDGPEKKLLKPPMPPSKEAKPSTSTDETAEQAKAKKSPDANKKTGPPPTPPNKPISKSNPAESMQSSPPTPPSKEKKPSQFAVDPDQQNQGIVEENNENGEDNSKEMTGTGDNGDKAEAAPRESGKIPWTKQQDSEEAPRETTKTELQVPAEISGSSPQAEKKPPKSETPSITVSLNDPLGPLLCRLPGEEEKKAEEKSLDSGQHSDDDSEGSEGVLAASTAALRGSHAGLDVLDSTDRSVGLQPAVKNEVRSKGFSCRSTVPSRPLKLSKVRSASIGDLLASEKARPEVGSGRSPSSDIMKLETEVAVEMEKTSELLRVSQSQGEEDLLARAMEKLKMAEHVLREVKKLKLTKGSSNRKSW